MSWSDKRFNSLIFNYETTSRTDFRDGEVKPIVKTEYKEKSSCVRIRPLVPKDIHTLTDWTPPKPPFSLMHKPKEIIRTNPRDIQKVFLKPVDEDLELVQRSRPRLVMTPACSLDDIQSSQARELLVGDMYTSTVMKMNADVVAANTAVNVRSPYTPRPAPTNPVALRKLAPPYVAGEWRMDSASWDTRQRRTYCDPTMEFWLRRKKPDCKVCKDTAERRAREKMKRKGKH